LLYRHCTRDEFVYRHRWRPGDVVLWDNRCVIHKAVTDYTAERYMQRTTVIADRPVA
jgi:taurine dioxygenase